MDEISSEAAKPGSETAISKNARLSWYHARYTLGGKRFPQGEPAMAQDAFWSCYYATKILGTRFLEGEEAIARIAKLGSAGNQAIMDEYFSNFPDTKLDWAMKGWLDWSEV